MKPPSTLRSYPIHLQEEEDDGSALVRLIFCISCFALCVPFSLCHSVCVHLTFLLYIFLFGACMSTVIIPFLSQCVQYIDVSYSDVKVLSPYSCMCIFCAPFVIQMYFLVHMLPCKFESYLFCICMYSTFPSLFVWFEYFRP